MKLQEINLHDKVVAVGRRLRFGSALVGNLTIFPGRQQWPRHVGGHVQNHEQKTRFARGARNLMWPAFLDPLATQTRMLISTENNPALFPATSNC